MEIEIKNCNSIDIGKILIEKDKLNIKYGINGTGKTTITKAIEYTIDETKNLDDLRPFKYKSSESGKPQILGLDEFKNISVFNEDFVNNITFKENGELLDGSFDIFINNDDYKNGIKEIEKLTFDIKSIILNDEEIKQFLLDLGSFIKITGNSKDNVAKNSAIYKALGEKGNIRDNIPTELEDYSDYIKSDIKTSVGWISWQLEGKEYLSLNEKNCPYCVGKIEEDNKKKIDKVNDTYKKNDFKYLNETIKVLESLSKYFSISTNGDIQEIKNNINGLTPQQLDILGQIKQQSFQLFSRLDELKVLGFFNIKNIGEIEKEISKYIINLSKYSCFDSSYTKDKIDLINKELQIILDKIIDLKQAIGKQKTTVNNIVRTKKEEIGLFLKSAGYKYTIDLEEVNNEYKLVLKHLEYSEKIENAKDRLSYGEKNAFALVLFMFQAIYNKSDFIILDDPISSFDNNKKYSILNRLFGKAGFFRDKTVLMLTHDFEPIVDIIYHDLPSLDSKNAYFLRNDGGILSEKIIEKEDVKNFLTITKDNISNLNEDINKLIYIRRLFELNNDEGNVYSLLSSLFHKKNKPDRKIAYNKYKYLEEKEIKQAIEIIKNEFSIINFDYYNFLQIILDDEKMIDIYNKTSSGYEKLQLYRIIRVDSTTNETRKHENKTLMKFVNGTFHIENDYIYQLNPCNFEIVPEYIINLINSDILSIQESFSN